MPVDLVRDAAIDVLLRVFERGARLENSLDKTLRRKQHLSDRGRRFLTQLAYGVVRHRALCEHALRRICRQPLDELPPPIAMILRMGVFQALFCDNVTPPAMVHTSVDLAKRRGHAGTARLVNAVLRKAPHSLDAVRLPGRDQDLPAFLAVRHSMPRWLVDEWITQFGPERAETLCAASNTPAPWTLRANTLRTTPEALRENLARGGFAASPAPPVPEALVVAGGGAPLLRTKWFQKGHYMVQDPASMLPAHLLQPKPGEWVLDLCAAPGGKTTHLAALAGGEARILAMDPQPRRLHSLIENILRLGVPGVLPVAGQGEAAPCRPGFDAVLVDAPCSGLGTLRRHPDLKWRMTPETRDRLAAQQRDLLRSAVELCKNGGRIVYAVCTLARTETEAVVESLLQEGRVICEDGPEWFNRWKKAPGQYQTLPDDAAWDGFFLTRFRKRS